MYLSRLILNPASKAVWSDLRAPRELHRTLMHAFPATSEKQDDFRSLHGVLHRVEDDPETQCPTVLVQSRTEPDWDALVKRTEYLREAPRVRPLPDWETVLKPGREFRFRLCANPTRKIDTKTGPDGNRRNGKRKALRTEAEQIAWLIRKAEQHGFEIVEADTAAGALALNTRIDHDQRGPEKNTHLASVCFEGHLRVTDPAALAQALRDGIGSGKAYGFGLLSLAAG